MRIGLISDTHIPEAMPELPAQVGDAFSGVDLILHAGDLHCLAVLDELERIAPVLAARGNGDDGGGGRPVLVGDARLKDAHLLTCHGLTLGLAHDVPDPQEYPQWPVERSAMRYFGRKTDFIICGHTHVESVRRHGAVWVVNPGSATLPHNYAARPGTVGVLTLNGERRGDLTIVDLRTLAPLPGLCVTF